VAGKKPHRGFLLKWVYSPIAGEIISLLDTGFVIAFIGQIDGLLH
jgi:hypothetical protein